ncbi:MAG: hypothetical protein EXR71_16780 [Myxococcales bacterium]|nr:hypothetical protein [Myxococcales bacterium]
MPSHGFTDKSLAREAAFGGWALDRRTFAEPGVEPHYPPDRDVDILHYDLDLWIDPVARSLRGQAHIRVRPLAGRDGQLGFDLDELTVDGVERPDGSALAWSHHDGKLRVAHTDELIVRWHGSPRRGLYFVGPTVAEPERDVQAWTQCQDQDAHFIFPCLDHPSVKHPWRARIHVPPGFDVVGNGARVEEVAGVSWVVDAPMPAYLFTAVVARLDRHVDHAGDVPVHYLVPMGIPRAQVLRAFLNTPRMIDYLASLYGPYPWARYDQVVVWDFIFGGMENLGATTLFDIVLVDDAASLDTEMEDLVVHELGHQWWGNLVTCQDWSQGWLNEGWATYTEVLWFTHSRGRAEGDYHRYEQLQAYLAEDGSRYRRPIVSYHFKSPIDVFDRHLYEKGALVLHTLRTVLGDDAFWAGTRLVLGRHGRQTVHTRHLQRAFEDASGRSLDRFFAEFVFGAGHPTLKVELGWDDGQLRIGVKQTQEGEGVASAFAIPLLVSVAGQAHTLQLDARERTFVLPVATKPAWVGVDAEFGLLAEITLSGPVSLLAGGLAHDGNVVGRIRAARALATEGSPEAMRALVSALSGDAVGSVRGEIAEALASTGQVGALDALILALGDPDPKVRRRVVAAMGSFRRQESARALLAMRPDASIHVRGEIARVLGRLHAPEARAACEALLAESSWSEVLRARALEGLGWLRDASCAPLLLEWTGEERPVRVRAAAVAALARLGDEVEAVRTPACERLVLLAEDPNFRVQLSAINALGVLRDPRALGTLARIHRSSPDGRCRRLAWEAMRSVRDGRTLEGSLGTLRKELEGAMEDNKKLRDRVTRLEDRK